MSKLKDNLFQVAVDKLYARRQVALEISNHRNLRVHEEYEEQRNKEYAEYSERLYNGESATKILKEAVTRIDCWREAIEEEIFQEYISSLDWADDEFAKESKALDSFVTYDDELSIEGE